MLLVRMKGGGPVKSKQIFLLIIPCYVMVVGLLYTAKILFGLPLFSAVPPGSYYLMSVSVFFFSDFGLLISSSKLY